SRDSKTPVPRGNRRTATLAVHLRSTAEGVLDLQSGRRGQDVMDPALHREAFTGPGTIVGRGRTRHDVERLSADIRLGTLRNGRSYGLPIRPRISAGPDDLVRTVGSPRCHRTTDRLGGRGLSIPPGFPRRLFPRCSRPGAAGHFALSAGAI